MRAREGTQQHATQETAAKCTDTQRGKNAAFVQRPPEIKTGTLQRELVATAHSPDHMPTAGIELLIVIQGTSLVTVPRFSACLNLPCTNPLSKETRVRARICVSKDSK